MEIHDIKHGALEACMLFECLVSSYCKKDGRHYVANVRLVGQGDGVSLHSPIHASYNIMCLSLYNNLRD